MYNFLFIRFSVSFKFVVKMTIIKCRLTLATHQWIFWIWIYSQYRLYFFTLFSFSLIQVFIWMNLWREPIVFRKVTMAFSFYLIKYNLWAERCFVYKRCLHVTGETCYISDVPKVPPTGREWMCIFNNPVCSFGSDQCENPPTLTRFK